MRFLKRSLAVVVLVAGVLFAVGADPVRLGYVNVLDDAPVHVAYQAGYYKQHGLDVDLVQFASGTDLIKGIVTGRLDVGVLGFTNALTWASRGADLRIVGGAQRGYHSLLVRRDRGIDTVSELRKHRLASQKQGSTADIVLTNIVLARANLEKRDLTMRYVSPAVAVQALVSGAVDAAFLFEPYARIARYTAPVKEIYEVGKVWPFPCMVVITSGKTWRTKRETIGAVLDAQKQAIELIGRSPSRAAGLITKYFIPEGYLDAPGGRVDGTTIITEALRANTFEWRLTAKDVERMREIASIMSREGLLGRPVSIDHILDLSWQANHE
jgi:NitT/TauT family transport system substrate-binding protein